VDKENDKSFLDSYCPCPMELLELGSPSSKAEEMMEKYGSPDWYFWCIKHWGTKWAECDTRIEYETGSAEAKLDFDTAWSPPLAGYTEISKQFPSLRFEIVYDEPCMGFGGEAMIQNGMIEDNCREYEDDEDEESA